MQKCKSLIVLKICNIYDIMLYWHQNKCSVHLLLSDAAKLYRKWLFIGKEVWPSSICLVGRVHSFEPLLWVNKICTLTNSVLTIWLQLSLANHHTQTHLITELCSKPWGLMRHITELYGKPSDFGMTIGLQSFIGLHSPTYIWIFFLRNIKISRDWEGGRELTW